jgi:hypothetical protein
MILADELLRAYDDQLRTEAETPSAIGVERLGPLRLVTFAGGRGFVTYRDLGGSSATEIAGLVVGALTHFEADPEITRVEWKARGHDVAPGLHGTLLANGFEADDAESIMIGEASALVAEVQLPDGVTVRRVTEEADVRAMCRMQDEVFGDEPSESTGDAVVARLARADGMELWIAEADGVIVSAGRLEPVPGTEFAGIWGGATREEWRGRGIYRALTSARAASAIAMGKRLINSDSTEFSRPILERSGFMKVSTTTPYRWRR